jgi:hypothetical protein
MVEKSSLGSTLLPGTPDQEIEVAARQLMLALGRRAKEEQASWPKDIK